MMKMISIALLSRIGTGTIQRCRSEDVAAELNSLLCKGKYLRQAGYVGHLLYLFACEGVCCDASDASD